MSKIKTVNYYCSVTMLCYLAGTYILLFHFIFGGSVSLVNINHIVFSSFLIFFLLYRPIAINAKTLILFGFLFTYILIINGVHSLFHGDLKLKSELVYIIFNFILGYCVALSLSNLKATEQKSLIFSYEIIVLMISAIFLYYYFGSDKYLGFMITYPAGHHDKYQTLSAYLARYLCVGILMFTLFFNQSAKKAFKNIFLISFLFALISLLSISKKETILFLLITFFLYMNITRNKTLALIWISLLVFLAGAYFGDYLGAFYTLLDRSIVSRIDLVKNDFSYLYDISGVFGSIYIYDQTGIQYPHSFTLSMLISYGIFGVLFSWASICYVLYKLFKRRMFVLFLVLLMLFVLANIATHFDYMVLWFALGLMSPIAMNRQFCERNVCTKDIAA